MLCSTGMQLLYNVALVSSVQQAAALLISTVDQEPQNQLLKGWRGEWSGGRGMRKMCL